MGDDYGNALSDNDLQKFVATKELEIQLASQVHHLTNVCWDKCMDGPSDYISSKQTTCLQNCVERFLDCTLLVTNRTVQRLQTKM